MKRTRKLLLNVLLILILIIGSLAGGFYANHIIAEDEKESMILEHEKVVGELQMQIPQRSSVIVLAKSLEAGSKLEESDLMTVQYDIDLIPEEAILSKEEVVGMELKIGKCGTTILTANDVYEKNNLEDDHRESQFSYIRLPDKLTEGDYVDVRILFPTGQDYVVLSKKRISDLEKIMDTNNVITKQTIWSILDEEEIKRIGSAVVDAYIYNGELYAIEYVEPFLQKAAKVNYPENANVLAYIAENSGVVDLAAHNLEVKLRSDLESSLIQYLKEDVKFRTPTELDESSIISNTEDITNRAAEVIEPEVPVAEANASTAEKVTTDEPEEPNDSPEESNSFN